MLLKLQKYYPQHWLSSFAGFLANCKVVWLKNMLIQYFVWRYPINLAEALQTDPYQYSCFNDLFTRQLQPDARPIAMGLYDLVAPADGNISKIGEINEGQIIQAKGHDFSVQDLLGGNSKYSDIFRKGSFATVYLAPKDYHRVHMPIDGTLTEMIYIPGTLFSVNPQTASCTPNLFARNERVVTFYQTNIGPVAVVLVGAMIVGSIETVWAGTITPPRKTSIETWNYTNRIHLKRGNELGRFKLGSTVILLFPEGKVTWDPTLTDNSILNMGERIVTFKNDQL